MLVEDNAELRTLLCTVLKNQGYIVLASENAETAIENAGLYNSSIHLLITDVMLPGMNGKMLYEKLKEKRRDLRVLYMSGYTANIIAHHGVLDRGCEFIHKPFDIVSFIRKVNEINETKEMR